MDFTAAHAASLVGIGLSNLGLAAVVVRTRSDQDVVPLGGFLVGTAMWTIPQGFLLVETDPTVGLALSIVINAGAVIMATGLFHFALVYTGRTDWVRPGRLGLIYLGTCTWIVVIVTDPIHNWMHQPMAYTEVLLPVVEYQNTGYWLYVFWNWSLSAGGIYLFFLEYLDARGSGVYHKQARLVVLAPLIPGAANVLAFGEVTAINYSVWGFGATGILIAVALYRYRWLDLVPIARDRVIDEMRDGYLVVDEERRIVDLNPSARTLVGEANPVGKPLEDVLPACGLLLDGEKRELSIVSGESVVDATASFVGDGRSEGAVLMLRDVTEARRAEKRFQALIENVSDVVTVVDEDGRITYASPSVRSVLGYRPAEVVGESLFSFLEEAERDRSREAFDALLSGSVGETRFEYRARHRDGSWVGLEGVSVDLLDNDVVGGVVISLRDVTERNERERELERTNNRLDEFAGVISHDLQSPLRHARTYVGLAADSGRQADLAAAEETLERMETMIQRFLTMARAGTTIGETEPVAPTAVALASWRATGFDEARFVCELEEEWTTEGDFDRLRHVFENLFLNAVEHNDRPITVRLGSLEDETGFFVEDDGAGIEPAIREFVFERGHTTSDEGTGFGLAIVRDVVEAHGWTVSVGEGRDGGARFEFVTG